MKAVKEIDGIDGLTLEERKLKRKGKKLQIYVVILPYLIQNIWTWTNVIVNAALPST